MQSHPYQFVHVIEIYTSCVFFQQLFRVSIPFNYDLSIVKNTRSYRRWFTILFIFDWAIEVRILTFDSIHHIDLYVRYSISDVSIYLIVMERLFRDAFFFLSFSIFMGIDLKSFWNSSDLSVLILNKSNDFWLVCSCKRDRSNIVTISRRFKFNCSMFFAILHWISIITRYNYYLRKFYNRITCFINYLFKMHIFLISCFINI